MKKTICLIHLQMPCHNLCIMKKRDSRGIRFSDKHRETGNGYQGLARMKKNGPKFGPLFYKVQYFLYFYYSARKAAAKARMAYSSGNTARIIVFTNTSCPFDISLIPFATSLACLTAE